MTRKINQAGLALIESFEGCKLKAYKDGGGVWTIGVGHTPAYPGQTITQQQADALLHADLATAEAAVERFVTVPLTDNQFAALVSFTFNLGPGRLKTSTLLKKLNARDYAGAAAEFIRWNKDNGKEVAGLTRRRRAEAALFERK